MSIERTFASAQLMEEVAEAIYGGAEGFKQKWNADPETSPKVVGHRFTPENRVIEVEFDDGQLVLVVVL